MTDNDQYSASMAGDRAELERDAERAAAIKKAELLAWCYERAAALREAEHQASKPQPEPPPRVRAAASAPATVSAEWRHHVDVKVQRSEERTIRATMKAVAEVVVAEERARERDIAALREQVTALQNELGELKDRRLRAVPPSSPAALIA